MNLCEGSGKSIAVDKSHNVFFSGEMIGQYNNPNFFIVKYDSSGGLNWIKTYDGLAHDEDAIDAMALDKSGNIYVAGHVSQGGNSFVYCTIKYNILGDSVWIRNYGIPTPSSQPYAMVTDDYCNIYITGMNNNSSVTVSYDSSGNFRWANTYPMSKANAITKDSENNIFIVGEVADSSNGGTDYLTIKYSFIGIQQWMRKYTYSTIWSPANTNSALAIKSYKDGNIFVTGHYSYNQGAGTTTIKYNTYGDSIWVKKYANAKDFYMGMTIDSLSNIYISTGYPDSIPQGQGGYLTIKYDSSGNLCWSMFYSSNCPLSGSQTHAITSDLWGNIFITGWSETPLCFNWEDITTIKYSQPLFGIKKIGDMKPINLKVYQNYPNPFNSKTIIKFDIPFNPKNEISNVTFIVYDILGQEIYKLNQKHRAGTYQVEWDASNFSSGIYFYRLNKDNIQITKKMVIIK